MVVVVVVMMMMMGWRLVWRCSGIAGVLRVLVPLLVLLGRLTQQ